MKKKLDMAVFSFHFLLFQLDNISKQFLTMGFSRKYEKKKIKLINFYVKYFTSTNIENQKSIQTITLTKLLIIFI